MIENMLGKRFEVMSHISGHVATDMQEGRGLNRIIRAVSSGWEFEGD